MANKEFDVKEHVLVPKHRIVSLEEKEEIKKKYRINSDNQFPKIIKKDPIVKSLDANNGDLLEIIKKSSVAGETVYYRIVVD